LTLSLILHVLLALAVVVVSGRLFGRLVAALGQPPVIGEVLSGILLGPSLLGLVAPAGEAFLFPPEVRPPLAAVAQAGVVLYMFIVGLEFDRSLLQRRASSLIVTSQASIVVPFLFGCALGASIHADFAPAGVSPLLFALFMGVAMSITAFPVLARILTDRGMTRSELGVAALTCAAINDVMAWCLLALVVGAARAMPSGGVPGELVLAFALGVVIPHQSRFAESVVRWLNGIVTVLLLPAFFALTGLRTQVALVSTGQEWLVCVLIVVLATAGKFGGAALAGRLMGMPWRFAAQLGALMNTRGLISPTVFTMMVIMALVTTALTAPMLDALTPSVVQRREEQK
jgi:Kef-type K+ transport system membrane component KefB